MKLSDTGDRYSRQRFPASKFPFKSTERCRSLLMRHLYIPFVITLLMAAAFGQDSGPAVAATLPAEIKRDLSTGKSSRIVLPPEKQRPVVVPKIITPIVIDGRPDEEGWQQAMVLKDFYQTAPGDNTQASRPTEARIIYDEKHLYISFKCWDEPDKIRATVAKRDEVFGEDNVRVWLDTYNDQRRAYVLGFNPLGIQQDGIYTEGRGSDFSVDVVMESKGVIEPWGWSVEVKIPFKSLRYTAGKGKLWGFNVARNIDRFNDEFDQWLPDDRNISGFLIKHGKLAGLEEIKYERTLEIVPSVTVSQTGRRTRTIPRYILNDPTANPGFNMIDRGRFVNFPVGADLGVTLKYTISPNVTLDAAVNPDFAEIEADAPVVTANQRFPIYFTEKRPFFLEGQDIFSTPMNIFYSRTIVDPDVAVKLTGKSGKNSFGFLAASDKAPGNYDDDDLNDPSVRPWIDEFAGRNAIFAVARVKRDFGKENNIGFMATYRGFPERKNLVASFDGRLKLSPTLTANFQMIGTTSRRCYFDNSFEPANDPQQAARNRGICGGATFNKYRTGNGIGYYASLDYNTDKRGWFVEAGGRSGDYVTDAGFARRTNTNFAFFMNRFSTASKPKNALIRLNARQITAIDYDWKGRLQGFNLGHNYNASLQKNIFISAESGIFYEKIYEEEFGLRRMPTRPGAFAGRPSRGTWQQYMSVNINQTVNKRFNYGLFVGMINNAFDFDFGNSPQDPQPGLQRDAEIYLEYKPIDPLRMSVSYRKSRLDRKSDRLRAFDSDIVSINSTYQFSRFLFTRLRLDHDNMQRNYSGQFLFGWNPNPGTAFYVGYNDNFNYSGWNPYTYQRENGFERNSRTFFIRASYLFRKSF